MNKGERKTVAVALSMQMYEQLQRLAREECRTPAGLLRYLLLEYLRKQEKTNAALPGGVWV